MLNTLNKASGKYELSTANAIWLQEDCPFLKDYQDTISRFYLGEVKNLDFVNNPSGASSDINNWVAKNTNNKITNIVSPDMFGFKTAKPFILDSLCRIKSSMVSIFISSA